MGRRFPREEPRLAQTAEPPPDRVRPVPRIVVIGAGFSGAMVAVHLSRAAHPSVVTLLERGTHFARGLAYGTDRPEHLLNVPAGRMSAVTDDAGHFSRFAAARGLDGSPEAFHPRTTYREYLEEILARAERDPTAGTTLAKRSGDAVDVVPAAGAGASVVTRSGERIAADRVVLALGNSPPDDPIPAADLAPDRYVRNPWAERALDVVPAGGAVLFLGTGLTCIDLVLSLRAKGHRGPLLAVSRRGLLPQPYVGPAGGATAPVDLPSIFSAEGSTRRLLGAVRREVARRRANGADWRDVVAALRPVTQRLWASLPERERARFLRHVRPFWETHRHRMPPASALAVEELRRHGALSIRGARVVRAAPAGRGVRVTLAPRGGGPSETIDVARVVNATGPSTDLARSTDPLVRALIARGLVVPDRLRLGLLAASDGAVSSKDGVASRWLFAVGPLRKPALWECTAVPELRVQAAEVAARVLQEA